MIAVLTLIYSLPFLVGMICGIIGMRFYCKAQARHADKVHPLPNGKRHRPAKLSMTWMGGLVAIGCVGYVLLQTQQTHNETVQLSQDTRQCQLDLINSIKRARDISSQNDDLSVKQRGLLAEINDVTGIWINRLINPPEAIDKLDTNDPRRQQYGLDVTRVYFERTTKLRQQVSDIAEQQVELAKQRENNELPPPRCGG